MDFPRFGLRTFRQTFFASYLLLFLVFFALIFPLVSQSVQHIVFSSMNKRIDTLIASLIQAPSEIEMIHQLEQQKHYEFFRIGLLDSSLHMIYDTHTKGLQGSLYFPLQFSSHAEMQQAKKTGTGYSEEYSHTLQQKMIYVARRFEFKAKPYYLRMAFPYQQIQDLRSSLEKGFIAMSSVLLLLFGTMSALAVYRMTRPIKKIIEGILPYREHQAPAALSIQLDPHSHTEFFQLAETINSLASRLQRQIDALKNFTANASHELKTPITIIKGFVETLAENPNLPKETVGSITDRILSNCTRMTKSVQNLLTLSTIEHLAESRLSTCSLTSLALSCIKQTKELYPHAVITLEKDSDNSFEITADQELLEVAISNLLDNGCKYAKQDPHVCLKLKDEVDRVLIEVHDNGIGIDQKDQAHIFERFFRVNTGDKKRKGSGLGLAIVQTIAQKHAGTVTVSSELGKGSCFSITIGKTRSALT